MAKEVELKTKGVSFNVLDEDQEELYAYACSKSNFSGYVKRLIMKDMFKGGGDIQEKQVEIAQEEEEFDLSSFAS